MRLRGIYRIPERRSALSAGDTPADFTMSAGRRSPIALAHTEKPSDTPDWLQYSRLLIPGEALSGYLGLQALAKGAVHPENFRIILALIFCACRYEPFMVHCTK
jgi:hypothetical protein